MTIDDLNSVYVGGIPYDSTEGSLREFFDPFGKIVAIKIVNDRGISGKCYAFVTFTNPRSAMNAISDMDGRTIEDRVVRVNEVRTRGGRPTFHPGREGFHEGFRRSMGRGADWPKERIRERDHSRERPRQWDGAREQDSGYSRSRDHRQVRDRAYRDQEQTQDQFSDQDRNEFRKINNYGHNYNQSHDRDGNHAVEENRDRELDGTNMYRTESDENKDQPLRKRTRLSYSGGQSRDLISESSGDHQDQEAVEQLERSMQKRAELQNEISEIEERLEERQQQIYDMQKEAQKMEDSLTAKRKLVSHRQMQLTKLCICFKQVKEYNEKLKNSENELQSLVDSALEESDNDKDVLRSIAVLANGSA